MRANFLRSLKFHIGVFVFCLQLEHDRLRVKVKRLILKIMKTDNSIIASPKTVTFLSPLQVYGATESRDASLNNPAAVTEESYCWDSQKMKNRTPEIGIKEGTATGSNEKTSLEDWND